MPVSNSNTRPGSALVTVEVVVQDSLRLFFALNFAPTAAPVAPSSHLPPRFSGLHSPYRVTSETRPYTTSGLAAMVVRTLAVCPLTSRTVSARVWAGIRSGGDGRGSCDSRDAVVHVD